MSLELPKPISAYYEADQHDKNAVAACFTDDAVVVDEGHTYSGRGSIRGWKAASSKKYRYTVEPMSVHEVAGKIVVTAHLEGDFPGSPVDLRYFFGLRDDKIASLEIKL